MQCTGDAVGIQSKDKRAVVRRRPGQNGNLVCAARSDVVGPPQETWNKEECREERPDIDHGIGRRGATPE